MAPFTDVIHCLGLLHTARIKDAGFAKNLLSKALNQKYPDYCAILIFHSSQKGKPVVVFKIIKEGKKDIKKFTDKFLPNFSTRCNFEKHSMQYTLILEGEASDEKLVAEMKRKLYLSASMARYRYIISYDISREMMTLWSRRFKKLSSNE